MDEIRRVDVALAGGRPDRPPYSIWYHFGTQHLPGEQAAEAHLAFLRHYRLDWLKVMSDYRYPLPAGMRSVETAADLRRFAPLDLDSPNFAEQLRLLRRLDHELRGKVYFVETVFNPFGVALRTLKEKTYDFMRSEPEAILQWLETVAESFARYVRAVCEAGAAGVFFSVNGANRNLLTEEEYERFVRPFDLKVLEVAARCGRFNVCHAHGPQLMFERLASYPCNAFNWSHWHTAPDLKTARRLLGNRAIIGGIDEVETGRFTPPQIEAQVRQAAQEAGLEGFMVGPGCAVPTDIPPDLIVAGAEAAKALGR